MRPQIKFKNEGVKIFQSTASYLDLPAPAPVTQTLTPKVTSILLNSTRPLRLVGFCRWSEYNFLLNALTLKMGCIQPVCGEISFRVLPLGRQSRIFVRFNLNSLSDCHPVSSVYIQTHTLHYRGSGYLIGLSRNPLFSQPHAKMINLDATHF